MSVKLYRHSFLFALKLFEIFLYSISMVINQKYDKYILDLYSGGYKLTWGGLKKTYPCIFSYLSNRFDDKCKKISEVIYRIRYGLNAHSICPVCGKPVKFVDKTRGYKVFCSQDCMNSVEGKLIFNQKLQNTCLERFGVQNPFQDENVKQKIKETCLERYGYEHACQSNLIKQRTRKTCIERYNCPVSSQNTGVKKKLIDTNIKRYRVPYTFMSNMQKEKSKETCLEKYGYEYALQVPSIREKGYLTMKQKGNFITSKLEKCLRNYLIENKIKFKEQYKSELYPFKCDFYLVEYDLYIEIQGHWHHGYNDKTKEYVKYGEDMQKTSELMTLWKQKAIYSQSYRDAIEVWSKRDVLKREIAQKNNLNYLEIFTNNCEQLLEVFKIIKI